MLLLLVEVFCSFTQSIGILLSLWWASKGSGIGDGCHEVKDHSTVLTKDSAVTGV